MSNLRLGLAAAALFGLAFAIVTFGTPSAPRPAAPPIHAPPPAVALPAQEPVTEPVTEPVRGIVKPQHGASGRSQLAETAIRAAFDYARAPCDIAVKAAFIVSASTYLRAEDADAAATPLDARAREAIEAALRTGGLSGDEFPAGTWAASLAKPSRARRAAPCASAVVLRPR